MKNPTRPSTLLSFLAVVAILLPEKYSSWAQRSRMIRKKSRRLHEIRFNKCPPVLVHNRTQTSLVSGNVSGVHPSVFPLMPNDYPLTTNNKKTDILRRETYADSIVLPNEDYQLSGDEQDRNASYWLKHAGVEPVYPGGFGMKDKFWEEFREVVRMQIAWRSGDLHTYFNTWPSIWNDKKSLTDIAKAVEGEYPGSHQQTLIESFFKQQQNNSSGIRMHNDMDNPFRSLVDFIGTEIRIASINLWAFECVAPINFMLKWHVGMPRPEEIAWLIHTGEFTTERNGVPADIVWMIQKMKLERAEDFTAYKRGSPMHPSFPAMHSAGSTCSYWMPVVAYVTPDQYCEALRLDYAVSYARTVAGVHYPMDNIAGLNIGQRIVQEKLPKMLSVMYGYNENMVRKKLDALAFDWNTFNAKRCTIGGLSTADFLAQASAATN